MSSNIDAHLEDYKRKILNKPPTIHEASEEDSLSQPLGPSKKRRTTDPGDVFDFYLNELAE
jgi:hypothetical protein